MKTTLLLACISMLCLTACQRDLNDLPIKPDSSLSSKNNENGIMSLQTPDPNCSVGGPYQICLIKANYPGNSGQYIWEWKVTNTNPGNGNGNTFQGLSHWSFNPSACVQSSNVVSAAYSTNSTTWYALGTSLGPDPSNNCTSGQTGLFKFNYGTNGSAPTYYRLILNKQVGVGTTTAYYKSGKKTGCGTISFMGILCSGSPMVVGPYNPMLGD